MILPKKTRLHNLLIGPAAFLCTDRTLLFPCRPRSMPAAGKARAEGLISEIQEWNISCNLCLWRQGRSKGCIIISERSFIPSNWINGCV